MRCYFFTNFYYSSIQQGIQPLHAVVEMFDHYKEDSVGSGDVSEEKIAMLYEWAARHKTVVCLNGGCHAQLENLLDFMIEEGNPYPWREFYEDKEALGADILTTVGIVLPERIYKAAEYVRRKIARFCPPQHPHFMKPRLVLVDGVTGDVDGAEECLSLCHKEMFYSQWEIDFITNHLNTCGLAK